MRTPTRIATALLLLVSLLLLGTAPAYARIGDPDSFTDNPAEMTQLRNASAFDGEDLVGFAFLQAWAYRNVIYGGPGVVDRAACIPGLDAASFDGDPDTECGGTNGYLVHAGARVLTPLYTADQVGFYYGSVGREVLVRVRLSDASVRDFVMDRPDAEGRGTAGYFGYATGDPFLRIEQIIVYSDLGGVDEVAFGYDPALVDYVF